MLGGYNLLPLIDFLKVPELADTAAEALGRTILVFDAWRQVMDLADAGNTAAARVIDDWAEARWFTSKARTPRPHRAHRL